MSNKINCYINAKHVQGNLYQIEKLDDKGRTAVVYDGYYNHKNHSFTLYPRKITLYYRKKEDQTGKHVISDRLVFCK